MRTHKMTDYDVGQILIKASDTLFECAADLKEASPALSDMLFHMGCKIGTIFNSIDSHTFGLRGLSECICPKCVNEGYQP